MTILVVDDEPEYRKLIHSVLADEGYEVHSAGDGEDALAKMAEVKIDLVVSDVFMPVMDGIALHRTIRTIPGYELLPFLFVSGHEDQHTLLTVKNPKIEGFLKKGKPVALMLEWIKYLSSPEDRRPVMPPGESRTFRRDHGSSRGGSNVPNI